MTNNDDQQPPPLKVGLTYNLKRDNALETEAEYDSIDTINSIKNALETLGHNVILLEADESLPSKLLNNTIDIVFNIAEGRNGRGREAHVPAILSYYGIKHTGADETTLCICLDKALAKRIMISHKVKTPKYQIIDKPDYKPNKNLDFPLIAKPNAEGSSKGIFDASIAKNSYDLKRIVASNFAKYKYQLLVEEYIEGREFTVGVLGNGDDTLVFRPMEIVFKKGFREHDVYDYEIKKDCMKYVDYVCPPRLSPDKEKFMMDTAKKIYNIFECRDFARIDFKLTQYNELYCIEINPLAGLTPDYSDFVLIAKANGVGYTQLIGMILDAAVKRLKIGGL